MAADESGRTAAASATGEADAEQQVQQLLTYADQVRAELSTVEEQRQMLSEVLSDYRRGREALKALKSGEADQEVLVPLGGGAFVPAKLSLESGKVLTSIGSGIHVEGTVDAALERLDSREETASKAHERMQQQARQLQEEMTRLNRHLQQLSMQGGVE